MSKTGNNRIADRGSRIDAPQRGFTLIEVMLTVAFLGFGTLLIQEGFLRSAGIFGHYTNELGARIWMSEKLWQAQEGALYSTETVPDQDGGTFERAGKEYRWSLQIAEPDNLLHSFHLEVKWSEGNREVSLEREVLVAKPKEA